MEEAEEVLSNGFIKVFDKLKDFEGKGSFEGWIRRIMVNEALNHLRKGQSMFIEVEVSEFESDEIMFSDQLEAEHLMMLIDQLPIGYRTVFNLFAIEGYKHDEIAEMLGISSNTSKSQLSKARKMLQQRVLDLKYL
jgi:RNA polymerase sigma-70 factor (ECF subfamily)